tara:strand:+ start:731 stop:1009 length:279 start_codon:yes stop_codon:yes gene_type:complete
MKAPDGKPKKAPEGGHTSETQPVDRPALSFNDHKNKFNKGKRGDGVNWSEKRTGDGKTYRSYPAGKGDRNRVTNKARFDENWERIFGKKDDK